MRSTGHLSNLRRYQRFGPSDQRPHGNTCVGYCYRDGGTERVGHDVYIYGVIILPDKETQEVYKLQDCLSDS